MIFKISKAPSVKDIDIQKRLDDISKFNLGIKYNDDNDDNDDDNDDNNNSGRPPIFPPTTPSSPLTLSETQRFLLDGGNERVAEAIGLTTTSTPKAKQLTFSETITKVFPKTREIIKQPSLDSIAEVDDETTEDDFDVSSSVVSGLKDGYEPIDLDFFCGGEKNKQKLLENATKNIGVLNDSNKKFISYLTSKYGDFVLSKNKIKIHLESGQIFHDNNITNESFL